MATPAIVVVTFNSAAALDRFGQSQASLARSIDAPLIIVDNASTDQSAEIAEGWDADVKVVRNARNEGYAAAVNRGVEAVPDRDVLLLNPDVQGPTPAQLNLLRRRFELEDRAGVVAPRLVGDDGVPQPSARRFPSGLGMAGSIRGLSRRLPVFRRAYAHYQAPSWSDRAGPVDWVIGAAMLIRRSAFDAVGGWDEHYFLYFEDVDFCRRCARHGWRVWFEPSVSLRHGYDRASTALNTSLISSSARRTHVKSMVRFYAKDPGMVFGRGRS